jgi:hypothetical protein
MHGRKGFESPGQAIKEFQVGHDISKNGGKLRKVTMSICGFVDEQNTALLHTQTRLFVRMG